MRTILEVFYVRIVGKSVRYQRRLLDLSKKGRDPDSQIWTLIRQKRRDRVGDDLEEEFIIHSTSWRYERPDKVLLTYVAYSDELEFQKGRFRNIPLRNLRLLTKKSRKPRSPIELEKKVVSHALRHIAFLIQTGDQENFKSALTPETTEVFENLWISLAGKVF